MATVSVDRPNVSQEDAAAALRDGLGSGCTVESQGSDTVKVKQNVFSHAKVRIQPGGGGTTFKITPFAVGPIGYTITALGLSRRIARALEQAPRLREGGAG